MRSAPISLNISLIGDFRSDDQSLFNPMILFFLSLNGILRCIGVLLSEISWFPFKIFILCWKSVGAMLLQCLTFDSLIAGWGFCTSVSLSGLGAELFSFSICSSSLKQKLMTLVLFLNVLLSPFLLDLLFLFLLAFISAFREITGLCWYSNTSNGIALSGLDSLDFGLFFPMSREAAGVAFASCTSSFILDSRGSALVIGTNGLLINYVQLKLISEMNLKIGFLIQKFRNFWFLKCLNFWMWILNKIICLVGEYNILKEKK